MLNYAVTINGTTRSVKVLSRRGTELMLEIDSKVFTVSVAPLPQEPSLKQEFSRPSATSSSPIPSSPVTAATPGTVIAPIPGAISDVRVAPGQVVSPGDVLVVLEAMKMENNIIATISGTIESVAVQKGEQVRKGQVLIHMAST